VRERDAKLLQTIVGPAFHEVDAWARGAGFAQRLQGFQYATAHRICDRPCEATDVASEVAAALWRVAGWALQKSHEAAGGRATTVVSWSRLSPPSPWLPLCYSAADHEPCAYRLGLLVFLARTQSIRVDAAAVPPCEPPTKCARRG
jgi:hypothetical protein